MVRKLKAGEITPSQAVAAAVRRIKEVHTETNAVVTLCVERAERAAAAASKVMSIGIVTEVHAVRFRNLADVVQQHDPT